MSAVSAITSTRPAASSVFAVLLPIMAVVLVAFLVIGLSLPILPLHVNQGLGLGAFVVGLVTRSQFAAFSVLAGLGGALFRQKGWIAPQHHRARKTLTFVVSLNGAREQD